MSWILRCSAILSLLIICPSCFVRTNRVLHRSLVPLHAVSREVQRDSVQLELVVQPRLRHAVFPLLIVKTNKGKAKFTCQLYGKGISGREYTMVCRKLLIYNDTTLVARALDPTVFSEEIVRKVSPRTISPKYATPDKIDLPRPRKARLKVSVEFELMSRSGQTESFVLEVPLEPVRQKSFTLFDPFEKP